MGIKGSLMFGYKPFEYENCCPGISPGYIFAKLQKLKGKRNGKD